MLEQNQVDAVIGGNDLPRDAGFRPVFADVKSAGEAFWWLHAFVPVNHMLTVRRGLDGRHPDLVGELLNIFRSAARAPSDKGWAPFFGRAALRPTMETAPRHMTEQDMLPCSLEVVWDGLPSLRDGE